MAQPLPKTIKRLGLVSLLTDASSEMIFPLLPAFLTGPLRAGPAFLGVVEGLAETTASVLRIVSGTLSDRLPRRKPLVVAGYGLASLARPLMAIAMVPWHVLAIRVADRIGKGTRGAPRDALIAEATPAEERGRAYGFHRAMDHAGAAVGPVLASLILFAGGDMRLVFALAAIPALLSVAVLVFGVEEAPRVRQDPPRLKEGAAPASRTFNTYLVVVGLFTLGNSSDAFLLLRAQEVGVSAAALPLLWAFHQLAKSALSTHGGALSDRLGRKSAIAGGWAVYALAYLGFAQARHLLEIWGLFLLYALHHALSEGPEKAFVADLVPAAARGRAFGFYHAISGMALLPASVLMGWLWQAYGSGVAFLVSAALAAGATVALAAVRVSPDASS